MMAARPRRGGRREEKKRDNMNRYTHWHIVMYKCTYVWNINVSTYIYICCSSITILLCTRLRHRKRINQLCTHEWTVLEAIKQQLAVCMHIGIYVYIILYYIYENNEKKYESLGRGIYMLLVQRKLLVQYLCNVMYRYIQIDPDPRFYRCIGRCEGIKMCSIYCELREIRFKCNFSSIMITFFK